MSPLPGDDAVQHDARSPTMVVDANVVLSGVVLLFLSLALVFVLYHYLVVHRRGQRDAAATPSSGGRRHGAVGATAASGVDPVVLRMLPDVTLLRTKDLAGALECAVCLTVMFDGEAARFLPKCGHAFHAECVDLWLRSHPTCPLCRVDVDTWQMLALPPVPPEPANYHTNLSTNVLLWGSQDAVTTTARTVGAADRPSSSSRTAALVIEVVPETT